MKKYKKESIHRVAIIGCGNIANQHFSSLKKIKGLEIVGVCDKELYRAKLFAEKNKISYFTNSVQQLFLDCSIDSVHILTPVNSHVEIAKYVLSQKCNVFIEKPLCQNIEQYNELEQAVKTSGKFASVNHSLLEDPIFKIAKTKITQNHIGEIIHVDYLLSDDYLEKYYNGVSRPWVAKQQLGVFKDLLPHPIYLIQNLLGEVSIENVIAKWDNSPFPVYLKIDFVNNTKATASLILSLKVFPIQQKITIYGNDGLVTADYRNFTNILDKNQHIPQPLPRIIGNLSKSKQYFTQTIINYSRLFTGKIHPYKGLRNTIELFYSSINENVAPPINILEGKKVMEIMGVIENKVSELSSKEHIKHVGSKDVVNTKATILVTGATGLLGSHIVNKLVKEGFIVRALCRESSNVSILPKKGVDLVFSDLRDIDKNSNILEGIKTVIHCASAMRGSWFDHKEVTIDGTRRLFEQCIQHSVKKVIHISSMGIFNYANIPSGTLIDQNSQLEEKPDKRGYYTKAKLLQENIVKEYFNNSQLEITIIRPGIIYDSNHPAMISDIGFKLKNIFIHLGLVKRNLRIVNVDYLAENVVNALKSVNVSGKIYNILDSEEINSIQYIKTYDPTLKSKFIIRVPQFIIILLFGFIDFLISRIPGQDKRHLIYKLEIMMKSFKYKHDSLSKDVNN